MIPAALMYQALVQLVDEEHLLLRVLDASPPALQRISSVAGRAARATSSVAGRSLCTRDSTPPAALDAGAISAVVCEHLLTRHTALNLPQQHDGQSATYGVNWCQCHWVRCGTGRGGPPPAALLPVAAARARRHAGRRFTGDHAQPRDERS